MKGSDESGRQIVPPPELTLDAITTALSSGQGPGSHLRTLFYFAALLGGLAFIFARFPWHTPTACVTVPYSLTALYLTWRLILSFFVEHEQQFAGHPDPPNLFIDAYVHVSDAPHGWWWSSILLLWVTVACPAAHFEAVRRGMDARLVLAYIAVAFLGAVSLSFPLFFTHLGALPQLDSSFGFGERRPRTSCWWAWPACCGASLFAILILPLSVHSSRDVFIVALLIVHGVLSLPFMFAAALPPTERRSAQSRLLLQPRDYLILFLATAIMHLITTGAALVHALQGNRSAMPEQW